jgi:hypothetical protein
VLLPLLHIACETVTLAEGSLHISCGSLLPCRHAFGDQYRATDFVVPGRRLSA